MKQLIFNNQQKIQKKKGKERREKEGNEKEMKREREF